MHALRSISSVMYRALAATLLSLFAAALFAAPPVAPGKRILFLGDSITYGATYVAFIDTAMILSDPDTKYDIIDIGLSSETVSGLSEPGHAGGKFPRPSLHERLDRVLARAKPDLVLACYGMNDGVYMPLDEDRFKAYREGMLLLRAKVEAAGAKIIHLTPPVFDPAAIPQRVDRSGEPGKMFADYNLVLDRYSAWLLEQKKRGWVVLDLHGPMKAALADRRKTEPQFSFAKDGVHPGDEGHQLMAQPVLDAWGITMRAGDLSTHPHAAEVFKLVREKTGLLRDAWLTRTEHKRPGVKPGLPLEDATAKAAALDAEARTLARKK